jgi:group I intron endonuclease
VKEKVSGIYCIENLIDGKKYIGQSVNLYKRINEHLRVLRKNQSQCEILQHAWNKYGEENFKFWIVEECFIDKLDEREIFWIKELHSQRDEWGYNISWGGDTPTRGMKHTQEWKDTASKRMKERVVSEDTKEKISKTLMGHGFLPESIEKMRNTRLARHDHRSDKEKQNLSDKFSGVNHPLFGTKRKGASSKYFGVSRYKDRNGHLYWKVIINIGGIQKYIVSRKYEIDAAREYDKYVIEHELPNPLNFPEEWGR